MQIWQDEDEITQDTTFKDDLGADSLDVYQIVMGIEEEFDIDFGIMICYNQKKGSNSMKQLPKKWLELLKEEIVFLSSFYLFRNTHSVFYFVNGSF